MLKGLINQNSWSLKICVDKIFLYSTAEYVSTDELKMLVQLTDEQSNTE